MFLSSEMHSFLLDLEREGLNSEGGWVPSSGLRHYNTFTRSQAQKAGYAEGRGSTSLREYRLTKAGKTALANNAEANLEVMSELENGFVPVPVEDTEPQIAAIPTANGHHPKRSKNKARSLTAEELGLTVSTPQPSEIMVAYPVEKNSARAEACVQAIAILSESFPEVADLVDALEKINQRKAQQHD